MSIDRLIQNSLKVAACGLLVACSGGGSHPAPTSGEQGSLSGSVHAPTAQGSFRAPGPSQASCQQNGRQVNLAATEVKVRFPENCVSGNIHIPAVTNLQSPPQYVDFCQGPQPLYDRHRPKGCTVSNPDTNCQRASSTFWYNVIDFYSSGVGNITFKNRRIPVKFSSSTFIAPGNLYGLCVIDPDAGIIQDDFASGNAVAPVGDTVDLEIVLPGPSYADIAINVYFESEPAE